LEHEPKSARRKDYQTTPFREGVYRQISSGNSYKPVQNRTNEQSNRKQENQDQEISQQCVEKASAFALIAHGNGFPSVYECDGC
jgi:hypothetical protein